jgi:hypothetical protein
MNSAMEDDALAQHIGRARELLRTARHAAMATVNADGSPHNTPYFFMCDDTLEHLYWGSHSESQHSKNILRTGQVFVVLYDMRERGGLYIRAEQAHMVEGEESAAALAVHNKLRARDGRPPIPDTYYADTKNPQRMWGAVPTNFWVNGAERDADGWITRDIRVEIWAKDLLT